MKNDSYLHIKYFAIGGLCTAILILFALSISAQTNEQDEFTHLPIIVSLVANT